MMSPKNPNKESKKKGSPTTSHFLTPCRWLSPTDILKPDFLLITSIGSLIMMLVDLSKSLFNAKDITFKNFKIDLQKLM